MKTEISEVLKEMVANGEIDTAMLTPQLRLMLIMSGVIVQTIEKNSAKKKALKEDVENVDVSGS
jgi:carbamoylphosphate synthase small subunit